jgi:3-hydroxybutyryl-CoA dehydrogenase
LTTTPSTANAAAAISTVLVVGAGTMGRGIAQVVAQSGARTVLLDALPGAVERATAAINGAWTRMTEKGRLSEAEAEAARRRLVAGADLTDAAEADLVIEAIVEVADAKTDLLRQLSGLAKPEAVLASNTSSISITRLAAAVDRPDRVVGLHFFNPVPVMPLVEVVRGLRTSDTTVELATAFSRRLGKIPVVVNDAPGFVANRVLMPMINEAIFCLSEGVATKEAIDEVMKLGMSHPLGPLTLADLIGLDVCLDIMTTLQRDLGEDKYRPAPLLRRLVDAGKLGRKSGEGFYTYER